MQMEGQCYKCGTKGHITNTCTKSVPKRAMVYGQDEDARCATHAS